MPLKTELLLGLWCVAGVFSIYIGVLQLRFPDAAWERVAESLQQRGKEAKRTKRWDRSRVFTGTLTTIIGGLLLVMACWFAFVKPTEVVTKDMSIIDPVTGKMETIHATPEDMRQYYKDPAGFVDRVSRP